MPHLHGRANAKHPCGGLGLGRILALGFAATILTLVFHLHAPVASAAPQWQFPWLTGDQKKIDGNPGSAGYSYNCGDHTGVDYYAIDFWFDPITPQPVAAAASGSVIAATTAGNYGRIVDIDHGGGYISRYAHLDSWGVSTGMAVSQGQTIGNSGSSGFSSGIHLHFRVLVNGAAYKPEPVSGITGFAQYGACTGLTSPFWTSRSPIRILSGDYDGSTGKTDPAVWRSEPFGGYPEGMWHIKYLTSQFSVQFGRSTDIPAPADYNGDLKTDVAVFRPDDGAGASWFYIENVATVPGRVPGNNDYNGNGTIDSAVQWGRPGDLPVPGDYNGDHKADVAVWRPDPFEGDPEGMWWFQQPNVLCGYASPCGVQWGRAQDVPVAADYNGGGVDIAVWRPYPFGGYPEGQWWFQQTNAICNNASPCGVATGVRASVPIPGDYSGDGLADVAVWHPDTATGQGLFYVEKVTNVPGATLGDYNGNGTLDSKVPWGRVSDLPAPGDYNLSSKVDIAVWRPDPLFGYPEGMWWFHQTNPICNNASPCGLQWGRQSDIPLAGHHHR